MNDFRHISVLLEECIEGLDIKPDGIYVDLTAGGAGHSREIASRLTTGRLIAVDRDPDAVKVCKERLSGYNATVVRSNYSQVSQLLEELEIDGCDGILMDLGVSSYQLDTAERGFSYNLDAPLDMRMSKEGISARDIVNEYSYEQLAKIIFEYGEERFARNIAAQIIKTREQKLINTTSELSEIIKSAVPARARREKNPCKRTFQAIRIAVNQELEHLSIALDGAFYSLKKGGRLCVITFHSLEDRLVKQRFASFCKGCICPPDFPKCVCGRVPEGRLVCKKPILPSETEAESNRRSRSAKLRIIERL